MTDREQTAAAPRRAPGRRRGGLLPALMALFLGLGALSMGVLVERHGWSLPEGLFGSGLALWLAAAPLLLGINLILRFFRWQFLLRGTGLRIPARLSLRVYLSGFAFNFTPLYLGPTIFRIWALQHESPAPALRRRILGVAAAELFYDAAGLAAVGLLGAVGRGGLMSAWPLALALAISAAPWTRRGVAIVFSLLVNAAARLARGPRAPLDARSFQSIFRPGRYVAALALSAAAWSTPPMLLALLQGEASFFGALPACAQAVAEGTLAASVAGAPGGAGLAGPLILERASAAGIEIEPITALLYRLGTFWLALGAGAAVWILFRRSRQAADGAVHFEEIAAVYDAQIPAFCRDRLLERKTEFMSRRLPPAGPREASPRGLDIGCGHGRYGARLETSGRRVVGVDPSREQLIHARPRLPRLVAGEAESLPFAGGSFDFVYAINVLHHLPSAEAQQRAAAEIRRILKPGGLFFLHEINTRNWLFRFYMGYLFPIIREIDTGVERWIVPGDWSPLGGWAPEETGFYTFLPDFLPEGLARRLGAVERRLEQSRWRRLSAHYSAVFVNPGAPAGAEH